MNGKERFIKMGSMLYKMKKIKTSKKVKDYRYWEMRRRDDPEKDWDYGEETWLDGYIKSVEHPHRKLIGDALVKFYPFGGILEIGCGVGANLIRLAVYTNIIGTDQELFPETKLTGTDVNRDSLNIAKEMLPRAIFKIGNVTSLPFEDKSFDVVICDAVLIYVGPDEIEKALSEIDRVVRKYIIFVERFDESLEGKVRGYVWARNYTKLLENFGFKVEEQSITKEVWPTSKNWVKYGRLFIAVRQ